MWYQTSYLLDRRQSRNGMARERFENYKQQPLEMKFPRGFSGSLRQYGLSFDRSCNVAADNRPKAAIIREKKWLTASTWLASM